MNDKRQWFEAQCLKQGICAEDIFVVGDYATNKKGDLLQSMKHREGEDTLHSIDACELIDCESTYAEWLWHTMYYLLNDSANDQHWLGLWVRTHTSWALAQVFRECICRNEMLSKEYREELRKTPVYGVLEPAIDDLDSRKGQFLGLCDETSNKENRVILPEEVKAAKGYRFALKVVDIDKFVEQYAFIRNDGQHGPFQILADLEKFVTDEWKKKQHIVSNYAIYIYDGPIPDDIYDCMQNSVLFRFSHFEIEDELDEKYRTIYACYREEYDL